MPRWFTLTADHIKAAAIGNLVDNARTKAVGGIDPVQEAIDNATARVQRAIAPGNVLDADPTKIPASLKGVAEQLVVFALQERIGHPRSDSQEKSFDALQSDLHRIAVDKVKVELPDDPATSPTIAPTGMKAQGVDVPRRLTGRRRTSGL